MIVRLITMTTPIWSNRRKRRFKKVDDGRGVGSHHEARKSSIFTTYIAFTYAIIQHQHSHTSIHTNEQPSTVITRYHHPSMLSSDNDLTAAFRAKAIFMKSWNPASAPSVRDTQVENPWSAWVLLLVALVCSRLFVTWDCGTNFVSSFRWVKARLLIFLVL